MDDGDSADTVENNEDLARFVVFSRWIQKTNQRVKPDAFIPPLSLKLSVTRHKNLSPEVIWKIGAAVAAARPATLYGHADIIAVNVRRHDLDVAPAPVEENPNHANIVGWPAQKAAQKNVAQKLAADARFVATPGI